MSDTPRCFDPERLANFELKKDQSLALMRSFLDALEPETASLCQALLDTVRCLERSPNEERRGIPSARGDHQLLDTGPSVHLHPAKLEASAFRADRADRAGSAQDTDPVSDQVALREDVQNATPEVIKESLQRALEVVHRYKGFLGLLATPLVLHTVRALELSMQELLQAQDLARSQLQALWADYLALEQLSVHLKLQAQVAFEDLSAA